MEDLENSLAHIGYRRVRRDPECWRVAQVGETAPMPRIRRTPRKPDPSRSPALRNWLRRFDEPGGLSPYRVRRARRG